MPEINPPVPLVTLHLFVPALATAVIMIVIFLTAILDQRHELASWSFVGILPQALTVVTYLKEDLYEGALTTSMLVTMITTGLALYRLLDAPEAQRTAQQLRKLPLDWARASRYGLYACTCGINTACLDLFHEHVEPAGFLHDAALGRDLGITAAVLLVFLISNLSRLARQPKRQRSVPQTHAA
jgi:hypothetical protein